MTEPAKTNRPKKKREVRRPAASIPILRSKCAHAACQQWVEYDPWRSWVHTGTQAYSCRVGDRASTVATPTEP